MAKKSVTSKRKSQNLLRYAKEYGARDPLTLGVTFRLWSELQVLDKAIFIPEPVNEENIPLLIINAAGDGEASCPTRLIFRQMAYTDLYKIFRIVQAFQHFHIYLVFPGDIPEWHRRLCEPAGVNAPQASGETTPHNPEPQATAGEIAALHRQALLALVDGALDRGDREQFLILSGELKKIVSY